MVLSTRRPSIHAGLTKLINVLLCRTQMAKRITIRLAKEEDFDEVIQVSEGIYDGLDYLPGKFHQWLQSPDQLVFVAELQGKVVGLRVATIMPDRQTFVARALRVHRDHRGQGLSYQIMHAVDAYVLQLYPEISTEHHATAISKSQVMAMSRRMGGDKILLEHNFYSFQVTESTMTLLKEMDNLIKELCRFSKEEAAEFVLNKQNSEAIIPQNIMVIDISSFYEVAETNVNFIFQDGDRLFADLSLADVRQGKTPTSFSHGRMSQRQQKLLLLCSVYTNDKDSFKAHVVKQITSASQTMGQDLIVRVFHLRTSSSFDGKTVLTQEVFHLNQDIKVTSDVAVVFERKLKCDL